MSLNAQAPAFTPAFKTSVSHPAGTSRSPEKAHSNHLRGYIYEIFETTSSFAEQLVRKSPNYDLDSPVALEGARILEEIAKQGSELGKIRPCVVLSDAWERMGREPRGWGKSAPEDGGPMIALGATFGGEAFVALPELAKRFVVGVAPNVAGAAVGRQLETSPPWIHPCQWFIAYGFQSERRVGNLWRGRNTDRREGYHLPPEELELFKQFMVDLALVWFEACENDANLAEKCAVSFRNHRLGSVYSLGTQARHAERMLQVFFCQLSAHIAHARRGRANLICQSTNAKRHEPTEPKVTNWQVFVYIAGVI